MGSEIHPELRGFDSYELKLGDEMRGARASKGKSLLDVQRDLRIKAAFVDAIENADADAFPVSSYGVGYIKSYARYLDMDADDVYQRFCAESGFDSGALDASLATREGSKSRSGAKAVQGAGLKASAIDDSVISTRFLAANRQDSSISISAGLRGLVSIGMLAGLVIGLGYGGWTMLQNLQRVGFAPLPTAPEVKVSAPDFFSPGEVATVRPDADATADRERITLASIYAAQEIQSPLVEPRDGPISSIDPARAGVFAPPARAAAPEAALSAALETPVVGGVVAIDPRLEIAEALFQGPLAPEPAHTVEAPHGVHVLAVADAWVRIRDGARKVLFSGTLGPGERFTLPDDAANAELRAGNAGAVYILVDGAAFGPLGSGPAVAKKVSLAPERVRSTYPRAEDVASAPEAEEISGAENAIALSTE
ncbi:MAG: RodZ domain-containing protein [Pseudomonadota bacterium]